MTHPPEPLQELTEQIEAALARGDWVTASDLGAQLDEEEARIKASKPKPTLLGAALWYAQNRIPVFPLQIGSKIPFPRTKGVHDATTDEATIKAMWGWQPQANLGLATGFVVDVIDVDGPTGLQSLARMTSLPPVVGIVSTPRAGGMHLYVPATGRGNRAGIAPAIDYRGLGGYVVAPPSVFTSHTGTDGTYTWRRPLAIPPSREGTCAVCGQRMIVVEAGQTTHPTCDPQAVAS